MKEKLKGAIIDGVAVRSQQAGVMDNGQGKLQAYQSKSNTTKYGNARAQAAKKSVRGGY